MKRFYVVLVLLLSLSAGSPSYSQCSICTKTAQQLGEKPAKALNTGIVYLALTPLAILAVIGIRWWKANKEMF